MRLDLFCGRKFFIKKLVSCAVIFSFAFSMLPAQAALALRNQQAENAPAIGRALSGDINAVKADSAGKWTRDTARELVKGWDSLSLEQKRHNLALLNERTTPDKVKNNIEARKQNPPSAIPKGEEVKGVSMPDRVIDLSRNADPNARQKYINAGASKEVLQRISCVIAAGGEGSRMMVKLYNEGRITEEERDELVKFTMPFAPDGRGTLQQNLYVLSMINNLHKVDMRNILVVNPETYERYKKLLLENDLFGFDYIGLVAQDMDATLLEGEDKIAVDEKGEVVFNPNGGGGVMLAVNKKITVLKKTGREIKEELISGIEWLEAGFKEKGVNDGMIVNVNADMEVSPGQLYSIAAASIDSDVAAVSWAYPQDDIGPVSGEHTTNKYGTLVVIRTAGPGAAVYTHTAVIEFANRQDYPGLVELIRDNEKDEKIIDGNAGFYAFSTRLIKEMGRMPQRIQRNKETLGIEAKTSKPEYFITDAVAFGNNVTVLRMDESGLRPLKDWGRLVSKRAERLKYAADKLKELGIEIKGSPPIQFSPEFDYVLNKGNVRMSGISKIDDPAGNIGIYVDLGGIYVYSLRERMPKMPDGAGGDDFRVFDRLIRKIHFDKSANTPAGIVELPEFEINGYEAFEPAAAAGGELQAVLEKMIRSFSGARAVFGDGKEISREHRVIAGLDGYNYIILRANGMKSFKLIIAGDPRPTGEAIKAAQIKGAMAAAKKLGVKLDIIDLGIYPTSILESAVRSLGAHGAIMITASHNPIDNNGYKYTTETGALLNEGQMGELMELTEKEVKNIDSGNSELTDIFDGIDEASLYTISGNLYLEQIRGRYLREAEKIFGVNSVSSSNIKAVLDPNNGAAANVYAELLRKFGVEVFEINAGHLGEPAHLIEPKVAVQGSSNPNENALLDAIEAVKEKNADYGFVTDFDADRANGVYPERDGEGNIINVIEADPQEVAALNTAMALELADMRMKAKEIPDKPLAVAGHGPTSGAIERICEIFQARSSREVKYVTFEVGEINGVEVMERLAQEGYYPVIGVEGANGGTIYGALDKDGNYTGARCRDGFLNALFAAVILAKKGLYLNWMKKTGQELKDSYILYDVLNSIPGPRSEEWPYHFKLSKIDLNSSLPLMAIKTEMEKVFRERYWAGLQKQGFDGFRIIYTDSSKPVTVKDNGGEPGQGLPENGKGGWKIELTNKGVKSFMWCRASATEPIFRYAVEGSSKTSMRKLDGIMQSIVKGAQARLSDAIKEKSASGAALVIEPDMTRRAQIAAFLKKDEFAFKDIIEADNEKSAMDKLRKNTDTVIVLVVNNSGRNLELLVEALSEKAAIVTIVDVQNTQRIVNESL